MKTKKTVIKKDIVGDVESSNFTRTLEEVKQITYVVEKNDGKNINRIIFPNSVTVGLEDDAFRSDLSVKGKIVTSGAIHFSELNNADIPSTVEDGKVIVYGKDDSGVTKLYFKNESGETLLGSSGGTPGGANTQVQFNNAGAFQGSTGMIYNDSSDTLTVSNLVVSNSPAEGVVPKFVYLTKEFHMASSPSGNPTNDFHLKWSDGTVQNIDPENQNANAFWKYFPYGGEIISVSANGSIVGNSSTSNPFVEKLVIALYTWTEAFGTGQSGSNTNHAHIGAMTGSASNVFYDTNPGGSASYSHRAIYNFASPTKTGTFVIPAGQLAALSVKGEGGGSGFDLIAVQVVYKMNLS